MAQIIKELNALSQIILAYRLAKNGLWVEKEKPIPLVF